MANTIITPSIIAKEALMQLDNNLVMGQLVHRDYKDEFVKVGSTVSVRRPVKFTVSDGATFVKQDVTEGNTSIVVDKRKHVGWGFSTQDLTLSIEAYSERYIKPAMIQLANQIDLDTYLLYKNVWNWVGTPGTNISSFAGFAKGPERLDLGAVPQGDRAATLSPTDFWAMTGSQTALFIQPAAQDAYRRAKLGMIGNVDTWMTQNVQTHTVGAHGSIPTVFNGTNTTTYAATSNTGTMSLRTSGWTISSALKQGDVFTISNVYAVNPVTRATLPHLQQFVINADVTTDGTATNQTVLNISPPIITSGAYQTVNSTPASGATITYKGTASTGYAQNMVFHKNAFALVMVPLEMPDGVSFKARESYKGLSCRVIKTYDNTNDEENIRIDVLYGVKTIYGDLATRISGT